MQLKLSLKEKEVILVLQDNEQIVDEEKWIDQNNLLEIFFPVFDKMLGCNNITIESINKFVLDINLPEGYTTARIARTIVKTLEFAHIA